jgi:hypothetical protein
VACSVHEGVDGEPGFRPVGVVGGEVCVGVFLDPFELVAFFFVGETILEDFLQERGEEFPRLGEGYWNIGEGYLGVLWQ